MLRRTILAALAIVAPALAAQPATAQQGVKIGLITTQSGPNAGLGRDMVDGFNLAIRHAGGRLGGVPTELIVGDDQFRPDAGKAMAERMLKIFEHVVESDEPLSEVVTS
jgi:branched-chain amino acid transport system substrate-binding protein